MNPVFACTASADDWQQFLADPEKHWKTGFSARTLANCWQSATGWPSEVAAVLSTDPDTVDATPLIAIPEYRVPLPGGDRPSQSDILVLGRSQHGPFAMVVEGKVSESFGPRVGEWLEGASSGKLERWRFLCATLGVDEDAGLELRYQLFHRAASAILAARLHHAHLALLGEDAL